MRRDRIDDLDIDWDRIIHPLVDVPDTDDTKYDKYGRISWFKKNGVWGTKNHNDCKKVTPDNIFKNGDAIYLDNAVSLVFGTVLTGDFLFDSYDAWDNTCYVTKSKHGGMTWNITLADLYSVNTDRTDIVRGSRKPT